MLKIVARGKHFYVHDRAHIDRIFDLYEAFVLVGGFTERINILEVAHDEACHEAREKALDRKWREERKAQNRATRWAAVGDAA